MKFKDLPARVDRDHRRPDIDTQGAVAALAGDVAMIGQCRFKVPGGATRVLYMWGDAGEQDTTDPQEYCRVTGKFADDLPLRAPKVGLASDGSPQATLADRTIVQASDDGTAVIARNGSVENLDRPWDVVAVELGIDPDSGSNNV